MAFIIPKETDTFSLFGYCKVYIDLFIYLLLKNSSFISKSNSKKSLISSLFSNISIIVISYNTLVYTLLFPIIIFFVILSLLLVKSIILSFFK